MTHPYRGRFAPSPTGPLHFGSIVAAVASYADAKHHGGEWLVRIDDVDETRTRPTAEQQLLNGLERLGMSSDRPVVRQSDRTERYAQVLQRLIDTGLAYRCTCSRKAIRTIARRGTDGPIYPGTCRQTPPVDDGPAAWRVAVPARQLDIMDRIAGRISQHLARDIGDFVIRRSDGFTAYQLAVVVDDQDQGITQIVRGADLLWSTPRQVWLQQHLGFATPAYAHVPLVYGEDGRKLSKSDGDLESAMHDPVGVLLRAWDWLGQAPPNGRLRTAADFWTWAGAQWDIEQVRTGERPSHARTDPV